ncbi:uncharacterized protein PGTG_10808 [Puccinia graminis f. sp. tritici CRL 75-36-700-3]|uniref:Uncharacterized protein n=1 Tax=Puccinia graminis f. sp. tritici (strain CRL 75-36-700-3 / race SCCL) TaxID=418459 RepID=E3KK24_PUCGT|nr:uncharacterized protein PGTG_10808 [Puccinia graminis f. sp. tritici CRL 75-36-700-3]EFP84649.2 hypothetical protein PGTG_10808 [Puccinia graminis f. sp. tritici CRL 75-36-700-3]
MTGQPVFGINTSFAGGRTYCEGNTNTYGYQTSNQQLSLPLTSGSDISYDQEPNHRSAHTSYDQGQNYRGATSTPHNQQYHTPDGLNSYQNSIQNPKTSYTHQHITQNSPPALQGRRIISGPNISQIQLQGQATTDRHLLNVQLQGQATTDRHLLNGQPMLTTQATSHSRAQAPVLVHQATIANRVPPPQTNTLAPLQARSHQPSQSADPSSASVHQTTISNRAPRSQLDSSATSQAQSHQPGQSANPSSASVHHTTISNRAPRSQLDSSATSQAQSHQPGQSAKSSHPSLDNDINLAGIMSGSMDSGKEVVRSLTEDEMMRFKDMNLSILRQIASDKPPRSRMTAEMKSELDDLYYEFQRELHKLSIKHQVGPHLCFAHLGQSKKVKGGSTWNNFQQYDPEALALFDEFGKDVGGDKVAELWKTKDDATKKLYKDIDFLISLTEENADAIAAAQDNVYSTNGSRLRSKTMVSSSHVSQKKTMTMVSNWVRKTEADLKSMAFFHQVEGFFVVASRHPKSTIFEKGGSALGYNFLEMMADKEEKDTAGHFHTWVAAKAIQIINGIRVDPSKSMKRKAITSTNDKTNAANEFDMGTVAKNVHAIREKLKEMIQSASGNKLCCAWPATDSVNKLKELKLKLHVKNNDWNIVPKDLFQPLSRLHEGPAKGILACLNTKRILITYHGNEDSEDETTDSTETESDSDDETDTTEDESDSTKSSVEVDNPPPKKRARKNSKTGSSKKKSGSSKKKSGSSKKKSVTSKKKPVTKSKSAVNKKSTSSKQKRTSAASTNQNSDTVTTQNSNTLTTQNSDTLDPRSSLAGISGAQEGGTGLVGDSQIQCSIDPLLETLA